MFFRTLCYNKKKNENGDSMYCPNCGRANQDRNLCECGFLSKNLEVEKEVIKQDVNQNSMDFNLSGIEVSSLPNNNHDLNAENIVKSPNRSRLFWGIGVFAVLIFLLLMFIGIKLLSHSGPNNLNSYNLIELDFINRKINANEYVKQTAYAFFDQSLLNKKYRTENNGRLEVGPHIVELTEKYAEELDETTLKYVMEKILLVGINFDSDASANVASDSGSFSLFPQVYASSFNVTTLNKAILSENEKFLVWYTDTGTSAISDDKAKEIAALLEKAVKDISDKFQLDFQYEEITKEVSVHNPVNKLMMGNVLRAQTPAIDKRHMETAFPIYVIDFADEKVPAFYCSGFPIYDVTSYGVDWFYKTINSFKDIQGMTYVPSLPYIMINPLALKEKDNTDLLTVHELTHHYQKYYCGDGKYKFCKSGSFTTDTNANYVAASLVNPSGLNTILNRHVNQYIERVYEPINTKIYEGEETDFLQRLLGNKESYFEGYHYFTFMHVYGETILDGVKKAFDSMKYEDALKFLYDSANGNFHKVMKKLAEKNLTNDYPSNAMKTNNKPPQPAELKRTKIFETKDLKINELAMFYYYFPVTEYQDRLIEIKTSHENVSVVILGRQENKYYYLDTVDISNTATINMSKYQNYVEVAIAIINSNYRDKITYSLSVTENPDYKKDKPKDIDQFAVEENFDESKTMSCSLQITYERLEKKAFSVEILNPKRYKHPQHMVEVPLRETDDLCSLGWGAVSFSVDGSFVSGSFVNPYKTLKEHVDNYYSFIKESDRPIDKNKTVSELFTRNKVYYFWTDEEFVGVDYSEDVIKERIVNIYVSLNDDYKYNDKIGGEIYAHILVVYSLGNSGGKYDTFKKKILTDFVSLFSDNYGVDLSAIIMK